MKFIKYIPILILVATFTSCGTLTKSKGYKVETSLQLHMDDLEYLGESEISCEYDTYLGFIRTLQKVNGETYVPGNTASLNIPSGVLFSNKGMRKAAAKLLTEFPTATYFQMVMETKSTDRMFLGSTTKRVAKIRAYKFK